jgi:iron complex transport system ATP-binding protein
MQEYSVRELARYISVVLTEQVHVGMLTSASLVSLGRYAFTSWTGKLTNEDRRIVHWALKVVGAENLGGRYVERLSDGERQKIMIARALAQEPRVILLDEPTAFLDVTRRIETMDLLRRLTREAPRAILLSTHDLELALRVSDRIFLLSTGGALTSGAPEDLVLSGAMEQAFQSKGLVFDRHQGSFAITQKPRGNVILSGKGLPRLWTTRALQRAGYDVSSEDAVVSGQTVASAGASALGNAKAKAVRIEILSGQDTHSWRLEIEDRSRICSTIYELIGMLGGLNPDEPENRAEECEG